MEFFNKIGKKASEAYDATAKKTGELAKEAKLRMKINENKSNINDLYKEIGKKVYEKHVREDDVCIKSEIEEECSKIDALSAEIEESLKSILELKNKKQCIKCHAELDLDAVFCSKCGERQPEPEVIEPEVIEAEVVTEKTEEHTESSENVEDTNNENSGDVEEVNNEDTENDSNNTEQSSENNNEQN